MFVDKKRLGSLFFVDAVSVRAKKIVKRLEFDNLAELTRGLEVIPFLPSVLLLL